MHDPDSMHTLMQEPKGRIVVSSLQHIATLTNELLASTKKNKNLNKKTRDVIIEINHNAIMAINHVHYLGEN